MPREFHLYDQPDGECALKYDDEPVCRFTNILEAVDYIRTVKVPGQDTMIVYDALGRVMLHGPL